MRRKSQALLWALRLGILAMLALALAVLYQRHHLSPEQEELVRYVEVEAVALRKVEGPIADRLAALLADRRQPADLVRRQLVDELIPGFLRLRQLAEAPIAAARTPPVQGLAREYLGVVDQFIEVCRTAVRAMDDPKLEARQALLRIGGALGAAVEKQRQWEAHVRGVSKDLRLAR